MFLVSPYIDMHAYHSAMESWAGGCRAWLSLAKSFASRGRVCYRHAALAHVNLETRIFAALAVQSALEIYIVSYAHRKVHIAVMVLFELVTIHLIDGSLSMWNFELCSRFQTCLIFFAQRRFREVSIRRHHSVETTCQRSTFVQIFIPRYLTRSFE